MEELKLSECKWPEVYISIPKEIAKESLQYQNKMTAVEKIIAEIEQELQDREGCNGALNSGAVLGLFNAKNIAHKYLEMEKEQKIEFACKVVEVSSEKYIQGKTTEQIAKELLTFKSE